MNVSELVRCEELSCTDVVHERFVVPTAVPDPEAVSILMVAESAPFDPTDWFYVDGDALFARTTVQAFRLAGEDVATMQDVLDLGVYLTTAVKCGKTSYAVSSETVRKCSRLLEIELGLFPSARVLLLMGDVAIESLNTIARRNDEPPVVPAGPTYELRGGSYSWRGLKVFPSYLHAGRAFFIEKTKRRMIGDDIAAALAYARS